MTRLKYPGVPNRGPEGTSASLGRRSPFNPPLRKLLAAAGSLIWLAAALRGNDEFRLYTQVSAGSEGGSITTCVWLAKGYRLDFVPPRGWSVQCQPTNVAVSLTDPELRAAIGMVLHAEPAPTNGPLDRVRWQDQAQSRYPEAKLQHASACRIAGREAWAFELIKTVQRGNVALVRVVVVPYAGGVAEFEMRTTPAHERMARRALRGVLSSLTIEPVTAQPPRLR